MPPISKLDHKSLWEKKIIIVSSLSMIPSPNPHPKQLLIERKDHRLAARELQVDLLGSVVFPNAKSPGVLVLLILIVHA